MSLSIYQLAIYTAHAVRGESFEVIAERLCKPVNSIKKTWYYAKINVDKANEVPLPVDPVTLSVKQRKLREHAEREYALAHSERCGTCGILLPADCTVAKCMARENAIDQFDSLCKLISAVFSNA